MLERKEKDTIPALSSSRDTTETYYLPSVWVLFTYKAGCVSIYAQTHRQSFGLLLFLAARTRARVCVFNDHNTVLNMQHA